MEKYSLDIITQENAINLFNQAEVINYCVFDIVCYIFFSEEDKFWQFITYQCFFNDLIEDSIYDSVQIW